MQLIRITLLLSAAALAAPCLAQSAEPQEAGARRSEPGGDDFHTRIVVTAAGLERLDVLAGTSVVKGIELQRELSGQIGDVLAKLPGVSTSGFAPGVSRPILRGFGGERVRVLSDGVGAIDASSTSDDHAVSVEPLIAERVEVLRGPAALLYGSQAIGGAVNVITKRIPPRVPDEPVHVDALAAFDTATDKREGGVSLDLPLGKGVAFHVDGSYRDTDDLAIPGYAASAPLRAELMALAGAAEAAGDMAAAADFNAGAAVRDILPNSATKTWTLGTGLALFWGESDIGASVDYYDTAYGIPGLPGLGEQDVSIGLKRTRADLRGTLDLGLGLFDELRTRWGYSDYTHTEFEGDAVGTVFDVEGVEGRVELVQTPRGVWRGSLGGQYSFTDFAAIGEEAFVPSSATRSLALFAVQEFDLAPIEIEAGGRYERTQVDASDSIGLVRKFDSISASAGLSYTLVEDVLDDLRAGLNVSRAERAPSAQELFADGTHVATRQFEIGNPALGVEGSWGVEAYLRGVIGPARMSASIYRNWFDGFVFLSATGVQDDGLDVFRFMQQDADQFGVEGEVTLPLVEGRGVTLLADLRGDYVRATLADGSPVPRIPPLSLLGALEAEIDHFDARAELQWFDGQDRVAPLETPTEGFTQVNLSLAWHPFEGDENFTLIGQVDNLFDTEGRRHASFTKDFMPLAGRNFKLSAKASF